MTITAKPAMTVEILGSYELDDPTGSTPSFSMRSPPFVLPEGV